MAHVRIARSAEVDLLEGYAFYERYGFTAFADEPMALYLGLGC